MQPLQKIFSLSWHTIFDRFRGVIIGAQTVLLLRGISTGHRKVFAIGFNKTATSSIHTVFQKLGMLSAHNIKWRETNRTFVFLKYEGFTDGAPDDFTVLDRRFKGSKFILNTRDLDEWIDSRLEHIKLAIAENRNELTPVWDLTDDAVKHWVAQRNMMHLKVLDHFKDRPDDLLVLNYIREPEPGLKIAKFLGKRRVVSKQYRRSTQKTREAGALRNKERIHRCLIELGVPAQYWKTDLHCPMGEEPANVWPYDTSELL